MNQQQSWEANYPVKTFGNDDDGVIEIVTRVQDGTGTSEAGCYYGKKTHPNYPIFGISVATGCRMRCTFCNTRLQPGRSLRVTEMVDQTNLILREALQHGVSIDANYGIKINIAKTGESLENPHLTDAMRQLLELDMPVRFKVATVFPAGKNAQQNLTQLTELAASIQATIQMQISLISTDEDYRKATAGPVASFQEIANAALHWRSKNPPRSQWNLSLILAEETPCNPADIVDIFPPEHFQIRPRDCIATEEAINNNLTPISEKRHQQICAALREAGYTVSLAGRPTTTEKDNRLAANATRSRV